VIQAAEQKWKRSSFNFMLNSKHVSIRLSHARTMNYDVVVIFVIRVLVKCECELFEYSASSRASYFH